MLPFLPLAITAAQFAANKFVKKPTTPSTGSTWGNVAAAGIGALGSALGGAAAAGAQQDAAAASKQQQRAAMGMNYQQMGQNDRQFAQSNAMQRAQYMDQRATQAADLQRRANLTPLSDRASFFMQHLAGAGPQAFQARDFTRGTMPGSGTANTQLNTPALQKAMQSYTSGAGGMSNEALTSAIQQLRDPSQAPTQYQAQSPAVMQLEAEIASQQAQMAQDQRPAEQAKYRQRIAALQQQLAALKAQG
jgi:hypothetical protein